MDFLRREMQNVSSVQAVLSFRHLTDIIMQSCFASGSVSWRLNCTVISLMIEYRYGSVAETAESGSQNIVFMHCGCQA